MGVEEISNILILGGSDVSMANTCEFMYSDQIKSIIIYNNGVKYLLNDNERQTTSVIFALRETFNGCREMPAFGVSLHNETIKAMGEGVWIEIVFANRLKHNELPFEKLLFQVNKEFTGVNIIRCYNGMYDGRCFYLDLMSDMSLLYEALTGV